MYLYIDALDGLKRVPDELMARFGSPQKCLSLVLEPNRRLARADSSAVIESIRSKGYYLQLPPQPGNEVEAQLKNLSQNTAMGSAEKYFATDPTQLENSDAQ